MPEPDPPSAGPAGARGQTALLAHLLELAAGGHLLSEQRGLNPVEQPFQPADQLRLGDAQLGVGRDGAFGERQGEAIEFFTQFRRQTLFEFSDAGGVDLAQPATAGLVERRRPHLFEELFDHGADPHHLGRLLDQVGDRPVVGRRSCAAAISRGSTPPMTSMSSSLLNAHHLLSRSGPGHLVGRRGATPFVDPGFTVVVDLRPPLRLVYRH